MSHARIFNSRDENLNLQLSFFFLALFGWELISRYNFNPFEINVGTSIAKILLLNQGHIAFTFLLFLYSPNVRSWYSQKKQTEKSFQWRALAVFALSFCILYYWLRFIRTSMELKFMYYPMAAGIVAIGLHHKATQCFGLSLLYNRQVEKLVTISTDEQKKIRYLENWERWLLRAMIVFVCAAAFCKFTFPDERIAVSILSMLSFVATAALTYVVWKYPFGKQSNKRQFCLRYLFFPFAIVSVIPLIALSALHGIEYLFVTKKMQQASAHKTKTKDHVVMIAIVMLFTFIALPDYQTLGWWMRPQLLAHTALLDVLMIVSASCGFLHFHMDSLMFKMRDPISRQYLAPLLTKSES